jgi:hypothetical protein
MAIFGQVWFACLVGFVVALVLDWLLQVRPLRRRNAELRRRLDERSDRADVPIGDTFGGLPPVREPGGASFEPSAFQPASGSAETFRPMSTTTDDELDELFASGVRPSETRIDAPVSPPTPPPAAETTTALPRRERPPARRAYTTDESGFPSLPVDEPEADEPEAPGWSSQRPDFAAPTSFTLAPFGPADQRESDQDYLDYLRSGPERSESEQDRRDELEPEPAERGGLHLGDYADSGYSDSGYSETGYDEGGFEDSGEVTSVMPMHTESGQPHEPSAAAGDNETAVFEPVDYFAANDHLVAHPDQNGTAPPPQRTRAAGGGPIGSAVPFQPEYAEGELSDDTRGGALTPISEGGFQPFARAGGEYDTDEYEGDYPGESAEDRRYTTQDFPAVDAGDYQDYADQGYRTAELPSPVPDELIRDAGLEQAAVDAEGDYDDNGYPAAGYQGEYEHGQLADQPVDEGHTQVMRPLGPPDEVAAYDLSQHQAEPEEDEEEPLGPTADGLIRALNESTRYEPGFVRRYDDPIGPETNGHGPAEQSRSLFEPVIDPEQSGDYTPSSGRPVPPPPLRVRTGIRPSAPRSNGSGPGRPDDQFEQHGQSGQIDPAGDPAGADPEALPPLPVRTPGVAAGLRQGPFGPGSALPGPDGRPPAPQFRIKARTSSMVFHTESSPFYERLEPQVWFSSSADAERAGFTSWERPGRR